MTKTSFTAVRSFPIDSEMFLDSDHPDITVMLYLTYEVLHDRMSAYLHSDNEAFFDTIINSSRLRRYGNNEFGNKALPPSQECIFLTAREVEPNADLRLALDNFETTAKLIATMFIANARQSWLKCLKDVREDMAADAMCEKNAKVAEEVWK